MLLPVGSVQRSVAATRAAERDAPRRKAPLERDLLVAPGLTPGLDEGIGAVKARGNPQEKIKQNRRKKSKHFLGFTGG